MPETSQASKSHSRFKNWVSLLGMVIAAGGLIAFFFLFFIDIFAHDGNPYMGILAYVVAPGFMFFGFGLVFLGVWLHHRHLRRTSPGEPLPAVSIDLSRPRDRRVLACFLLGTIVFLVLTFLGSYQTYHYTESVQFCGQACHVPMKPEFVAYQNSPHARVECVECHVGSGADAYVKSKINGVHQLIATFTGDYHRPIKTPIPNLRPAQHTCEQCHWPDRNAGSIDRTYVHYLADETNTHFAVRLSLHVGGGSPIEGASSGGIHWHMNLANKVEYYAEDEQRQNIPWIRTTDPSGKVTVYRSPDYTGTPDPSKLRTMDCIDCHNRPAHIFHAPNDAVDLAMSAGLIDPSIPWIKSNVVAALIAPYETEAEALTGIVSYLKEKYPEGNPAVQKAVAAAQDIFKKNIFPEMKADWRAYPDHSGHKQWAGCFRCHDGSHKTADGAKTIAASSCNSCHTILAQGSGEDMLKLNAKGHDFFHIDSINEEFSCMECHTGAFPRE